MSILTRYLHGDKFLNQYAEEGMKKDVPVCTCARPVTVYTRSGDKITVPCGKCDVCRSFKSYSLSKRLELEMNQCYSTIFSTLTLDQNFVRKAFFRVRSILKDGVRQSRIVLYDFETNEYLGDISEVYTGLSFEDVLKSCVSVRDRVNHRGLRKDIIYYFPKKEIQKFIKRLRQAIFRYVFHNLLVESAKDFPDLQLSLSNSTYYGFERYYKVNYKLSYNQYYEKASSLSSIRYFVALEYGPNSFRPHFHCLFFFRAKQAFEAFGTCIHKVWKYGNIDYSVAGPQSASYVAKYVNSVNHYPKVLDAPRTKSYCLYSKAPILGCGFDGNSSLQEFFFNRFVGRDSKFARLLQTTSFSPWLSVERRLYPRCSRFGRLSHSERKVYYRLYKEVSEALGLYKLSDVLNFFDEFEEINAGCRADLLPDCLKDTPHFSSIYANPSVLNEKLDIRPLITFSYYAFKRAESLGISIDEFLFHIEDYYNFKDYLREDRIDAFLDMLYENKNLNYPFYHSFLHGYGYVRNGYYEVKISDFIENDLYRSQFILLDSHYTFEQSWFGAGILRYKLSDIPEFESQIRRVSDNLSRSDKMRKLNESRISYFI